MTLEQKITLRNARQEEKARRVIGRVLEYVDTTIKCALIVACLLLISD